MPRGPGVMGISPLSWMPAGWGVMGLRPESTVLDACWLAASKPVSSLVHFTDEKVTAREVE